MISEAMKTTIKTLFEKGYNKSQISRMLQIDRKTVRAKLKESDEELPKRKLDLLYLIRIKNIYKLKLIKIFKQKEYLKIL